MFQELSDDDGDHITRSDDETNNLEDNANESANENEQEDKDDNKNDESRRIDPATSRKRIVRNPIPKLNTARLRGPKGVHTIENYFEGFKFHGKGHEKDDLDRIMKRIEHWSHRLFPKYQFDDFLEKVEGLGAKRDLQTFLTKYRQDMLSEDAIIDDVDGDTVAQREASPEPVDAFDLLIAEQIEKTKQATMSPRVNQVNVDVNTNRNVEIRNEIPSSSNQNINVSNSESLNDEVKKRIERNRQLAIERRQAKLKRNEEMNNDSSRINEDISQSTNSSQIDKDDSCVVPEIICTNKVAESFNEEISDTTLNDNKHFESTEINTTRDQSNLSLNNQMLNLNTTKPLLTDEELDRTIDDAVNQFMNEKRKLNQ